MRIWYDITNTPQVHFLLAIDRAIQEMDSNCQAIYTARHFSETVKMMEKSLGNDGFIVVGGHHGKSYAKKILGLISRFNALNRLKLDYDVSVSCGSESAIWQSWQRRRTSIAFGDNDQARQWTYSRFVSYAFFPRAIDKSILEKQGLRGKLYQYDGYKEDIYLSYYKPDRAFLSTIPFEHYVVVRPENVMANYIRNGSVRTIIPDLLKELDNKGINILYLPRYDIDREYAKGRGRVYIPQNPINGLDACYFSDAVLTGAGTLAREAACLGVPAFSFYSGKQLLAVDKEMISEKRIFYSRDVKEISAKLLISKRHDVNLRRCIQVREEVAGRLKELLF